MCPGKLSEFVESILESEGRRGGPVRKLRVFDFDDTLVRTDAVVGVVDATGERFELTPAEFAEYEAEPGDEFDFEDFRGSLRNPRTVRWVVRVLRNVYDAHGPSGAVVLTARSDPQAVVDFIDDLGMPGVEVVALGPISSNAVAQEKARWISERIDEDDLTHVEFFDDSAANVEAVARLRSTHPHVDIRVRRVT